MKRCAWVDPKNELYVKYHDNEWGVPVHDDRVLFEFLILEGAQAGLSWITVLQKREGYHKAFHNFDVQKVAELTETDILKLKGDTSIIRNELKIRAAVTNAKAFIKIQEEFGSFDSFLWSFVDGTPIINRWKSVNDVPATTKESDLISKELKKRGFKFVGSTIIYAYMQAIGMVNDHTVDCFRYASSK
ncbi:DNA-3-methyladenine glycosylase I [Fulvivirgaceae bacterium BMA12]|uniref:DNA-3-methyladenine glycosylase I n=1 Tax=Agaribacillus aureus TaxID=3051825 RepID=A0ABT8L566_9BACT|nr:DNA-3-methyladenine glycosylase I [Fulvivirgaceae bacterium BMA12]